MTQRGRAVSVRSRRGQSEGLRRRSVAPHHLPELIPLVRAVHCRRPDVAVPRCRRRASRSAGCSTPGETPEALRATRFSPPPAGAAEVPRLALSLVVPARHEQAVLAHTLDGLAALDHADFEIIVIVGHDDPETAAVAERPPQRDPAGARRRRPHEHEEQAEGPQHRAAALPRRHRRRLRRRGPGPPRAARPRRPRLPLHRRGRRPGRRPADQLPLQLVQPAQLPGVLLLVPLAGCTCTRRRVHPARRQHRLRAHATSCARPTAGTPTASPRTATWACGSRCVGKKVVVAYDSRHGHPGGDARHAGVAAQAAHPLEPGLPAGLPEEGLEATARPAASGCSPATR